MAEENGFQWVNYYLQISEKLIDYKDRREDLAHIVEKSFIDAGCNMPKVCQDEVSFDNIDPFSFFAFFNKNMNKRNELAISVCKNLGIECDCSDFGFKGIPVVNPLVAMYYNFDERRDIQIDSLWGLFETAHEFRKTQSAEILESFNKYWDESLAIKCNSIAKISMGFYWAFPDFYLNLDSYNFWYLFEYPASLVDIKNIEDVDPFNLESGHDYLKLKDNIKNQLLVPDIFPDFPHLSAQAHLEGKAINEIKQNNKIVNKQFIEAISAYKNDFNDFWEDEKYKWQAVKHFQENWNIDAENFDEMLREATAKTINLLDGVGHFPIATACDYSKQRPAEVKEAFACLFNENKPMFDRINGFIDIFDNLNKELEPDKQHFQSANVISTYLWLRYPDQYFVYKFSFADAVSKAVGCDCAFTKGSNAGKILACYELYGQIRERIIKDSNLASMLEAAIDADCYEDKNLVTLTCDFARYCDYCKSNNDGRDGDGTGVPETGTDDVNSNVRYWIYAPGENARLWEEFYDKGIMAIGWDEIGDVTKYNTREEIVLALQEAYDTDKNCKNDSLACWEFANVMKPGDVIFAKCGASLIIGKGIVESESFYDFSRKEYCNVRKVKWINKGEWFHHYHRLVMKTLTDITKYPGYPEKINNLFEINSTEPYSEEDFLNEVFMTKDDFKKLKALLKYKKNIVLQGPPGVGKTFTAERLAFSLIGEKNKTRIEKVQFHQNYGYEDFIEGFRPDVNNDGNFVLKDGLFKTFCETAKSNLDKNYFLIIDEINRGYISKIFGELFMLVENTKRGKNDNTNNTLKLMYSEEDFYVPDNLYIIGTMNTADRGIAMLDYALRRRFGFYDIKPQYNHEGFKQELSEFASKERNERINSVIDIIIEMNTDIAEDESLGEGFCIGHSYFVYDQEEENRPSLGDIVNFEIIPLIKEYWFDNVEKFNRWKDRLTCSVK